MATDAEIRAAGLKYIPQQKYLQSPFVLPTTPEEPVINQGIVNTNAFTGSGGNDFSVYNPDPNSIVNRNYQPNYDYRQFVDGYDPNLSATMNMKMMEVDPNYKGADYYNKPPSKMEGLMNLIPYAGSFVRGANFLGNQISPYLPVNRRSILENELSGKGIMVDDIGRIVQGQGDYNTAENIMAGYNANKITQETINNRKATINKSLGKFDKYDKSSPKFDQDKYNQMQDKLAALDKFGNTLDSTNTLTDKIYDFEEDEKEKKKKDTIVGRFITKRNEKKAAKEAAAAAAAAAKNTGGGSGRSYDAPGGVRSSDYNQAANVASGGGGDRARNAQGQTAREATYDGNKNTGTSQGYSQHYARGGRAGYFFGGRVNFKNGGLASIL